MILRLTGMIKSLDRGRLEVTMKEGTAEIVLGKENFRHPQRGDSQTPARVDTAYRH
jgi:hypothetical protein